MIRVVTPKSVTAGLVLSRTVPGLALGRTVSVSVLRAAQQGRALVSLFGTKLEVETPLPLQKGEVLDLKVSALSPRVILKPAEPSSPQTAVRMLDALVHRLAGDPETADIKEFELGNLVRKFLSAGGGEGGQALHALLEEAARFPEALSFFFIPVVDEEGGGRARVAVEGTDGGYILRCVLDTSRLGAVECVARLAEGLEVEIRTTTEDAARELRDRGRELTDALEHLGLKRLTVHRAAFQAPVAERVDMLV